MWASFYPAAAGRAVDFRAALQVALDGCAVTTADLQHFFVTQMRSPAEGALAAAGSVADELRQREADAAAEAKRLAEEEEEEKAAAEGGAEDGREEERGSEEGPARHVHLHLHADDRVVVEVAEVAEAGGKGAKANGLNGGSNGHGHGSDSDSGSDEE